MFEDYLNHRCDIYHLEDTTVNIGYGIKAEPKRRHQKEPELSDVPCHFHIVNYNTLEIVQREPFSSLEGKIKLSLPSGTDIKENDLVKDCKLGITYMAGVPRTVHGGHHVIVFLTREDGVDSAI